MEWMDKIDAAAKLMDEKGFADVAKELHGACVSQTAMRIVLRAMNKVGKKHRFDVAKVNDQEWNILVDAYEACLKDELNLVQFMKKGV